MPYIQDQKNNLQMNDANFGIRNPVFRALHEMNTSQQPRRPTCYTDKLRTATGTRKGLNQKFNKT
jgi:hypothetical protein